MSRRNVKKLKRRSSTTGPRRRVLFGETSPVWMHRLVEGDSVEEVNTAVRGTKGKKITTLRDFFPFTLVYPKKIEQGRLRSPLENPPSINEIAQRLGTLPLHSLTETVVAEVIDVRSYPGTLGIFVTYVGLAEETTLIDSTVNKMLNLRVPRHFTSDTPHILIGLGTVSAPGQLRRIENRLPAQLMLSAINPDVPTQ